MVAVSWAEDGSKINSEGMSSSTRGQFGGCSEVQSAVGGAIGERRMAGNLILHSTEIKPPYVLPI